MNLQEKIQGYLHQELPSYLELLRQMVEINSFTANARGVNTLGELTMGAFAGLGFKAELIPSVNPAYGNHLVLTRPGRSSQTLGLISHLDTVFPPDEEERHQFHWRPEGDRIYGPGTVDIKGGTVMIYMMLAALKDLAPEAFNQVRWVILLDASEEREADDFGDLCRRYLGPNALAALVFEAGRKSGHVFQVVTARKGIAVLQVTAEGRAAHAGSSHAQGANAIVQLADIIQQIAGWTAYEQELTFNIGVISGGSVTNRVPHHAEARLEMRAFSPDVFDAGLEQFLALEGYSSISSLEDGYPCRVSVRLEHRTNPWSPNPATDRLLAVWQEAAESLGLRVEPERRGGLSDGNHIWRQIPTLDGLGPAGGNAHCSERSADGSKDQEYVLVSSFVPKALLNIVAILRLIKAGK